MLILFALSIALLAAILAAFSDFQRLKIPNILPILILISFFCSFAVYPEVFSDVWWKPFAAMGVTFIVTFIMFSVGMMGGGDSKLMVALAPWVGWTGLIPYIFIMTLVGGVLGGIALWVKKNKPFSSPDPKSWIGQVQDGRSAVPYGIAITVGAIATMLLTGFIQEKFNIVLM